MIEIDHAYIAVALLWAVVGMLLGLYIGITADNKLLSIHTAILLPGFVTLAIFGMIYRLWPALKKAPLARIQFWLTVLSSAGIFVGSYLFVTSGSILLVAIASIAMIVGATLMAWLFIAQARDA